jgi:hypothetical protein
MRIVNLQVNRKSVISALLGIACLAWTGSSAHAQPPPAPPAPPPPPAPVAGAADGSNAVAAVHYCVPQARPGLSDDPSKPFAQAKIQCGTDRLLPSIATYGDSAIPLGDGDFVVVFVNDGSKPLSDWKVQDVQYTIGSGTPVSCLTGGLTPADYFIPCRVTLPASSASNDPVKFGVTGTAGGTLEGGYSRVRKPLHFSVAGSALGFWLPIGLFGSNFKSNADGITLAALPVGIAWGGQMYAFNNNTDYIGLSGFGSWTIAPEKNSDGSNTGNYSLQGISGGFIFDIDGYVYLGGVLSGDLRSGAPGPTPLAVLGIGPSLLKVLKAESATAAPAKAAAQN